MPQIGFFRLFTFLLFLSALTSFAFADASLDQDIAQGNQFYLQKDYEKALTAYQAALQLDSRNASTHEKIGTVYYLMGKKSEAFAEYRISLALNPNNPQLSNYVQKIQFSASTVQSASEALGTKTTLDDVEGDDSAEPEKPFVPHWTGAIDVFYSNQPSTLGSGQIQRQLGFTGTYMMNEAGTTNASVGVVGGRQIEEGADDTYGQLNVGGAIGFGFFQPSLQIQWQGGQAGLDSKNATLDLNFQLWDPFTIGLTESGGLSGHQGPVSQFVTQSDRTVEIDTGSWTSGIVATFVPWDFLSLSLTGETEYSDTFQAKLLNANKVLPINQAETIPSLTLGADITFLKDFVLGLDYQAGYEVAPAGTVYSPITGNTETFSQPTTSNFTGYTASLTYNLD